MFFRVIMFFFLLSLSLNAEGPQISETVYNTPKKALEKIFSKNSTIASRNIVLTPSLNHSIQSRLGWTYPETQYTVFEGNLKDKSQGYALIMDEMGKHYPMTFMVHITPEFNVGKIVFLVYRERIGGDVRKNRFLKQFKNKRSTDRLTVDGDINGISGATISSWAVAAGVKKALIIMEEVTRHDATKKES